MDKVFKNPFATMQKVTVATLCIVCMLFSWSCQSNVENDDDLAGDGEELTSLKGTKWKLAGIVDTKTGKLTKLEPKNCADCYTLTFVTDTQAEGLIEGYGGSRKIFRLDLSLLGEYMIEDVGLPSELRKLIYALYSRNTKSYSVTSNELRFINDVDNYYLLFKRIKP